MAKKSKKRRRHNDSEREQQRPARANTMDEEERRAARAGTIRSTTSVLIVASALFVFTYLLPEVFGINLREMGQSSENTSMFLLLAGIALALAPFAMVGSAIFTYSRQGGDARRALHNLRKNIFSAAGAPYILMFVVGIALIAWVLLF